MECASWRRGRAAAESAVNETGQGSGRLPGCLTDTAESGSRKTHLCILCVHLPKVPEVTLVAHLHTCARSAPGCTELPTVPATTGESAAAALHRTATVGHLQRASICGTNEQGVVRVCAPA